MIDLVWSFVARALAGVWNIFGTLFDRIGAVSYYLSFFVMMLTLRFLLLPFIGGAGFGAIDNAASKKARSDRAKKKSSNSQKTNNKKSSKGKGG